MNNNEVNKNIIQLEKIAMSILDLKKKNRPRRPIIIEFCGSPKSGKSSCITSLNIFLKRNGFKTKVLTERASVCPISNKFDPSFNIWTACSAITQLLNYFSNKMNIDVIIADRGIFDALCWFNWLLDHKHLDNNDYQRLVNFLTMKKWRSYIDLIYVFKAQPEISLKREYAYLLTKEYGRIMNPKVLKSYNSSIDKTIVSFEDKFRKVVITDTTDIPQQSVNYNVSKQILEILENLIIEKIGYFQFDELNDIDGNIFNFSMIKNKKLTLSFLRRDEVEMNPAYVQPVPILVITNKSRDKILLLKKKKESLGKNSPEEDKILLYSGGHVREEDCVATINSSDNLLPTIKSALSREINEELNIAFSSQENDPICFWMRDESYSAKHIAICFIYEVDFDHLDIKLDTYEFVQRKGKSQSGKILSLTEIHKYSSDLELWGISILKFFFKKDIKKISSFKQKNLI